MPLILRAPLPHRVSCILPTWNRRHLIVQALRCFRMQDYPDKELIVVDDGDERVEDLVRQTPCARYVRLRTRYPTGTKLNIGIEYARGAIIQKLDDDDYYGPGFLTAAARTLPTLRRERAVAAWCCFLAMNLPSLQLRVSGHGWARGGTLCFYRRLWKDFPFGATIDDHEFLRRSRARIVRVCRPEQYIYIRHGSNTCTKFGKARPEDYLDSLSLYRHTLQEHVDGQSHAFYEALAATYAKRESTRPEFVSGV